MKPGRSETPTVLIYKFVLDEKSRDREDSGVEEKEADLADGGA